ncbi:sulfite exporter TauE/SafE family protein [Vibrio sp. SCSIO 43135]|uniref:sulfite exporter TauE/SafE family protein n=1 Tax=Vibrio sp. SCSIO 43135 TaxID=2819096 RepID=UPI002076427C|nr:sulfite exporter TauE/SafE family protein [Vibrio sp. SCSIO 43135]USD43133.1 sulfite exporter TauE/SafE family protein [Vibrio sp. SCSIO 43135]
MILEWVLLFAAGVLGGIMNSIAGGGSFITFPMLMGVGVPPIAANATNTFAVCAGYLSGTYGFRHDIKHSKNQLILITVLSLIGGAIGAYLLLNTPEELFLEAIPWLLLFATVLFIFGAQLNGLAKKLVSSHQHASKAGGLALGCFLILVSAYGGFFNAGLGVIVLSYLALAGYQNINLMNGLKLLVSSCVSLVAIAIFVYDGVIDWPRGIAVLFGTLVGGYVAARVSRRVPQHYVRWLIIGSSLAITGYFFYQTYL